MADRRRVAQKRQAPLARTFGERLDPAVVLVAAAVEDGGLDPGRLGPLGQQFAGLRGALGRGERAQLRLDPVDRGQRVPGDVVDQLGEDALVGAVDGEARTLGRAGDPRADAAAAAQAALPAWSARSCALTDLPGDDLALVADALALVGLRRAPLADVGGDLADELLVDAADDDSVGCGTSNSIPSGAST